MRWNRSHTLMLGILMAISGQSFQLFAQEKEEQLPDSLRFTIRKDYRPVARDAQRILPQPELKYDTVKPETDLSYNLLDKRQEVTYEAEPIKAAKLSNEPLPKLYQGFLKAGFGNYTMPFFEASFGSLRSRKFQAGGFARYHASFAKLDKKNFGFTDAGAEAFAKYFTRKHVLHGKLRYDVDGNYYYGYDRDDLNGDNVGAVSDDSLLQVFHHVGLDLDLNALRAEKRPPFFDEGGLRYGYTRGSFEEEEHHAALNAGVAFDIKKERMFIRTSFDYYNLNMPKAGENNLIWSFEPSFRAKRERWGIDVGADLTLDVNDTTTKVLVFPVLDFHYFLVRDMLRFYVGAKGGVQRNGLRSISQVNPYFRTAQPLSNSWERLNVYGGFKGSITRNIGFDLSVAEIITGQQMFFVNDVSDGIGHRFLTEYHDTRVTRFAGALSYHLKEKLALTAEAEYRLFVMPTDSIKPWHEAPFRFTFAGNYNLKDKLIFKAAITAYGPRVARELSTDSLGVLTMTPVTLKGFADASIGIEYRYRKWLGAFVDLRNIASLRYDIWKQYPSQRFSFIAGVHFSF